MWTYDILNALLFFVHRVLALLGILFSILMIPFSILMKMFENVEDTFVYSRYIINSRLNNLRTFSFTVKVTVNNNIPRVSLQHYDDDTDEITERINETKFPSIRACIMKTFEEARRYSFVIFQTNSASSMFIQLRMDIGVYIINMPLTPVGLNRDYAIDFIKMLVKQGYKKTSPSTFYRTKTYSIQAVDADMTFIDANIGRNMGHAADFCSSVFTKLFKTTAIPEVIVG